MEDLQELTNETFNELFQKYMAATETLNHYEFALELTRDSTGYGTVFELIEHENVAEYTGYEPDLDEDFDHDGFFLAEVADVFIQQINDGIAGMNLKSVPYFEELYYDFLDITGYEGTKDDFEYNLKRSVDFLDFVIDISTRE